MGVPFELYLTIHVSELPVFDTSIALVVSFDVEVYTFKSVE